MTMSHWVMSHVIATLEMGP